MAAVIGAYEEYYQDEILHDSESSVTTIDVPSSLPTRINDYGLNILFISQIWYALYPCWMALCGAQSIL